MARTRLKRRVVVVRFSVVIPVHNKVAHVLETIQSVLAQTCSPCEIILVDDASTDGSSELIASVKDERIRILKRSEPGPGGYAARNLAIKEAKGEWVAFLDADDIWKSEHLEKVADVIEAVDKAVGVVFTGFEFVEPDGTIHRDLYSSQNAGRAPTRISVESFLDIWLSSGICPIWTGASVFRRDVLIDAGLFPAGRCRRGGDKDLWLRAIFLADAVAIHDVTSSYNRGADNMVTRTVSTQTRHCVCHSIENMIEMEPREYRRKLRRLFNQEIYNYVFQCWRGGAVEASTFQGFYVATNPGLFLKILLMWLVPGISILGPRLIVRKLRGTWNFRF